MCVTITTLNVHNWSFNKVKWIYITTIYYIKQRYICRAYISTNSKIYNILQRGSRCHTSITVIVFNVIVCYGDGRIMRKRIIREMCPLMVHVCRFDLQDLWTVPQVVYAVVYVRIYGKNIRLKKRKGWMWCCCVMNIFMIYFWIFVRLLSSLKWYDSLYGCLLFYNT